MTPDLPTTRGLKLCRGTFDGHGEFGSTVRVPSASWARKKDLKGADGIAAASLCGLRVVGAWVSFAPWDP
jgi:hypothetical protein